MTPEETALQKATLEKAQLAALAKAHGAAVHLTRIAKAVTGFHDQMSKLHKILGTGAGDQDEPAASPGGGSEPTAVNITAAGTPNIVPFDKSTPAPTATTTVMTAEQQNLAITKGIEQGIEAALMKIVPALMGKGDVVDEMECPNCKKDMKECQCTKVQIAKAAAAQARITQPPAPTEPAPVNKTAGVGDRNNVPVARAATANVAKAFDQPGPSGQPVTTRTDAETQALVVKAAGGDQEAQLALMKGSKPSEIPSTLIDPLSKIH